MGRNDKKYSINDDILNVIFQANQWKWLRVGIDSFYSNLNLCLQAIQEFEFFEFGDSV